MNLNTKIIFTNDEFIGKAFISKFDLKKLENSEIEIYTGKRETENELDNLVLVFCHNNNFNESVLYVKEHYIAFKYLILGSSSIIRNNDLDAGDIMIPNSFIDSKGEKPIFVEYAIGENFDLNKFGLILNGVCKEGEFDTIKQNDESIDEFEDNQEDFSGDIMDLDSYKLLQNFNSEDLEKTVVIRLCTKTEEDKKNKFFIDNLLNIVDVMI
ncbi:MAG: hypothetical protein WC850_00890 [Candidatus Gracilibacteria bacterium]